MIALVGVTPACSDDPPIVARGRYVELATHRSDPVCAGTMTYLDALIDTGFELLGEIPPTEVFVRYEWFDPEDHPPLIPTGHAQRRGDRIHIRANRIVDEHELVHAIHLYAWPRSARFMHEGLATLLDAKRAHGQGSWGWPASVDIDDVLAATSLDPTGYHHAWFIVSQIVFEHGIDGLRDLWHAIPDGASAQQVRDAYESRFEQPIDHLVEPYFVEGYGGELVSFDRRPCSLALCPADIQPWNGDVWTAAGPTDCEDDPLAVGPLTTPSSLGIGSVFRTYMLELPEGDRDFRPDVPRSMAPSPYDIIPEGGVGATLEPCWLNCANVGTAMVWPDSPWWEWSWGPGRFRVEVLAELDDLPRDPPGELHVHRNEP